MESQPAIPDEDFLCAFLPLTPPPRKRTQLEYTSNRIADILRHAGALSPDDIPARYRIVNHDGQPTELGTTSTSPDPPASQRIGSAAAENISQVSSAIKSSSDRAGYPRSSPDLPHLSAALNLRGPPTVDALKMEMSGLKLISGRPVAEQQEGIRPKDDQSLIPIDPTIDKGLYTVKFELDANLHPQHPQVVYTFSIDTADTQTWGFGKGFQQIKVREEASRHDRSLPNTCPWGSDETPLVSLRNFIVPINRETKAPVPFNTTGVPLPPHEWPVEYADGASLYVRHIPGSVIRTKFPCWDWRNRQRSTSLFELPCVLAFGANYKTASSDFDGNIGLAIPPTTTIANLDRSGRDRHQFFDAQRSPYPRVYNPGLFLIKLNHPDIKDACEAADAVDFLFYGIDVPCHPTPQFTPKLKVIAEDYRSRGVMYTKWALGIESMSLVPRNGPASLGQTIKFTDEPFKYRRVVLDSGSTLSYFNQEAINFIAKNWVLNSTEVLGLQANRSENVDLYCGPERDLDQYDILFKFVGEDGSTLEEFRCPSKPFLKSYYPLPSEDSEASPTSFRANVTSYSGLKNHPGDPILGLNFFWSAFIRHCGHRRAARSSAILPPYMQLAPQRLVTHNGTTINAEDFRIIPDLPPQFWGPRGEE